MSRHVGDRAFKRQPITVEERQKLESCSQEALQNSSLSSQSLADFCAGFPSLSYADFATMLAPVPDDDASKPPPTASPLPAPNESLSVPQKTSSRNKPVDGASASPRTATDNMTEELQELVLPAETHGGRMGCVSFPGPSREVAFDTLISPEGSSSDEGETFDVGCGSDSSDDNGSESDGEGSSGSIEPRNTRGKGTTPSAT